MMCSARAGSLSRSAHTSASEKRSALGRVLHLAAKSAAPPVVRDAPPLLALASVKQIHTHPQSPPSQTRTAEAHTKTTYTRGSHQKVSSPRKQLLRLASGGRRRGRRGRRRAVAQPARGAADAGHARLEALAARHLLCALARRLGVDAQVARQAAGRERVARHAIALAAAVGHRQAGAVRLLEAVGAADNVGTVDWPAAHLDTG